MNEDQPIERSNPPASPPPIPVGPKFTTRIVGVKFRNMGRIYDYDAKDLRLLNGDPVVCEHEEKGNYLGHVVKAPISVEDLNLKINLRPVLRLASHKDLEARGRHETQEKEILQIVWETRQKYQIKIHPISVELPLQTRKAIIYFSAPDRIDFRDLLRDLVNRLKMRVELRQLGARDETKYIGGIGPCGQETCCSKFINKFANITIKMAKDQELSLNPTKVTGNCGRLKCCLAYEQPVYVEARKTLPKLGNCVKCVKKDDATACGVVSKLEILKQHVVVRFEDGTVESVPVSRILEMDTMNPIPNNFVSIKDDSVLDESELAKIKEDEELVAPIVASDQPEDSQDDT